MLPRLITEKNILHKRNLPTVIILSASSDIGFFLAQRYIEEGYRVIGTYRKLGKLKEIKNNPSVSLFQCDISKQKDISTFINELKNRKMKWDIFISCIGDLRPLSDFFKTKFDWWNKSVHINSIEQLRFLHGIYPYRNKGKVNTVVYFAAGGVNKAVTEMSAYTISKIMLIKMCEYIDAEEKDLNIFSIGPGWIKSKIHEQVLSDKTVSVSKKEETLRFLENVNFSDMNKIFESINWLSSVGKDTASGRNFSLVYDPLLPKQRIDLGKELKKDRDMYKLRRFKSDYRIDPK